MSTASALPTGPTVESLAEMLADARADVTELAAMRADALPFLSDHEFGEVQRFVAERKAASSPVTEHGQILPFAQ